MDDRTLTVECNGCLGVTGQAVLPLSRGRRIVSHLLDVNAVDRFCACHPPLTGASLAPPTA
ncbi:DUF6461 domain-containing protein [Streptomyces sp. NPDC091972]|uniref:DUF6461 domain-containing protein n=1 Tax=Streptomyces sp. NPDC091972 TaxID=3366007 RepID=UPI00381A48FA